MSRELIRTDETSEARSMRAVRFLGSSAGVSDGGLRRTRLLEGTAGYAGSMVDPVLVEQATSLSVDERLELIGVVWDSIDHSTREVSPEVAALIEERAAEARANPAAGRTWDEVRQSLRDRRR